MRFSETAAGNLTNRRRFVGTKGGAMSANLRFWCKERIVF